MRERRERERESWSRVESSGGEGRGGLFEWCLGLRDKPKALGGNTAFRTEDSTEAAETSEKRACLALSNASPTVRLEKV